jgi:polysaccharide export outer membrane protein
MKAMMYQTLRAALAAGIVLAFFAPGAYAGPTPSTVHVGRQYRINPGDQLSVQVYGEQNLPPSVTVLPDGNIFYPLAGRVHVAGLTLDQATSALKTALSDYILHPVVSISVTQQGQISVLVLGNVKTPGKYQLAATAGVTDALAAAGGLGPVNGDYPMARVADSDGNVKQVDLQRLLHGGDTSSDVRLSDETTVYVPAPLQFNVEVFGAVDKPGDVTLNEGDRLAMAIARAGPSPATNPDLNHVQIRRTDAQGHVNTVEVNLYDILKSGDLSRDTPMQKGDIVYVPQAKKSFGQQLVNGSPILWALQALTHL